MTALRTASPLDAGKLGAIVTDWAASTDWLPQVYTAAEDVAHAGEMIDRGWVTVGLLGQRIAGFIACDGAHIHSLFIAPEARQAGLGSALLTHAMSDAHRLGLWTFAANGPARQFYAKHGFQEIGRSNGQSHPEALPDITFEWTRKAS